MKKIWSTICSEVNWTSVVNTKAKDKFYEVTDLGIHSICGTITLKLDV